MRRSKLVKFVDRLVSLLIRGSWVASKAVAIFAILTMLLAGCSVQPQRTFTPIEAPHPVVVPYDGAKVANLDCSVIWSCSFGNLTSSQNCEAVMFTFDVTDPESGETLVKGATSYWKSVRAGATEVEWGVNNDIPKPQKFSIPIATCLTEPPNPVFATSLSNFPASFCDGDFKGSCSAQSLSGWEMRQIRLKQEAIVGFSDEESTHGYTILCSDGWVSESGGIQGACSHHGGVAG